MKKKIMIMIVILFIMLFAIMYGIGNYFVNYALKPGKGGETREVDLTDEFKQEDQIDNLIDLNIEKVKKETDIWFDENNKFEEVSIINEEGLNLFGTVFNQKENKEEKENQAIEEITEETSEEKNENFKKENTWILILHGYQEPEKSSHRIAKTFYEEGFNVLTISSRSNGKSEGEYITMGIKEKYDVLEWIDFLNQKYETPNIFIHGTSMGGFTSIVVSGMENLQENVLGIIDDCGYVTPWGVFQSELKKRFNLPSFPVLNLANTVSKLKAGISFKEDDARDYLKNSKIPILFMHGEKDDFIPVSISEELYALKQEYDEKNSQLTKLVTDENAGHAEFRYSDPEKYYSEFFTFIYNVLDVKK